MYETVGGVRSLKYLITEEGRVVKYGTIWIWEYSQTDHLGNVRTVVRRGATTGQAVLLQDNHYFPYGMLMSDISTSETGNRFRYNGKEYQNDLGLEWYDYGARFYDPALARWHSVDPLCEISRRWSPYSYCYNNPVRFIDPDGMVAGDIYNLNGRHIGNDEKEDNKVYLKQTTDEKQMTQQEALDATNMAQSHPYVSNTIDITAQTGLTNDALNMNSMLGTIRESEGHGTPVGYNSLYGGGTFDSYDQHPNQVITKWGKSSSAAGAYQFLKGSWDPHAKKLGLTDFSPTSQDKAAVSEIGLVKGAIDLIHSGNYQMAIPKLSGKWTSLPGGVHEWKGFNYNIYLKHRANELTGKSIIGQ